MSVGKERLDVLVTRRGLVASRELAQRMILAGSVLVAGHPVTKAGQRVAEDVESTEPQVICSLGLRELDGRICL